MMLIDKKIISTTLDDSRFLKGENIVESFERDEQFGKGLTLYFEDETYAEITIITVGDHDEQLLYIKHGHWKLQDGYMVKVDE